VIDHDRKLIFVHIARTGGTSIETALVGADWWERDPDSKHLSASQTRELYGEEAWRTYYKFSVVRNPWDRVVSMWAAGWWHSPTGSADPQQFREFVASLRPHRNEKYNSLHYHEILDLPVDRVLRFERLQSDFSAMLADLGLPPVELPHVEKRDRGEFRWYYDAESVRLVGSMFERDIQTYGYASESPLASSAENQNAAAGRGEVRKREGHTLRRATPPMISYAQNHEDVLLARLFEDQRDGFYVDVGANDPVQLSVTKHFSDRGWRGINIEPGAPAYRKLCAARPRDVNLNVGIAAGPGRLTLYEFSQNDALSTFSADQAAEHCAQGMSACEREVPVTTLDAVCAEQGVQSIDFLTIDVEGFEREVLAGANLARWRPRVILIEATQPSTDRPTHAEWEPLVLQAGYLFAYFDGLNRFYLREDEAALAGRLAVPLNITDRFEPYEMVRLREQLADKDAALQAAQSEGQALSDKLATKHAELCTAQAAWVDLDQALRQKDAALAALHADAQKLIEQLQLQHEEIQRRSEDVARQARTERQQAETARRLVAQLADASQENARLREALAATQQAHQSVHQEAALLQRALQAEDAATKSARQQLESAEQKLRSTQQQLRLAEQNARKLQGLLQEKHAAQHRALADAAALQEQLRAKEAFLQQQNQELRAAEAALARLQGRSLLQRIRNAA
jgi:FkbM family methyltransferase